MIYLYFLILFYKTVIMTSKWITSVLIIHDWDGEQEESCLHQQWSYNTLLKVRYEVLQLDFPTLEGIQKHLSSSPTKLRTTTERVCCTSTQSLWIVHHTLYSVYCFEVVYHFINNCRLRIKGVHINCVCMIFNYVRSNGTSQWHMYDSLLPTMTKVVELLLLSTSKLST